MLLFHPWFQVGGFIPDFESPYLYQVSFGKVGFFSEFALSIYWRKFYFLGSCRNFRYITAGEGGFQEYGTSYFFSYTNDYIITSLYLFRELPLRIYLNKRLLGLKVGLGYENERFGDFTETFTSLPNYSSEESSFSRDTFAFFLQSDYPIWKGELFASLNLFFVSSPVILLSWKDDYLFFEPSRHFEFYGKLNLGYNLRPLVSNVSILRGLRLFSSLELSGWPRLNLNLATREMAGWQFGLLSSFSSVSPFEKLGFMVSRKLVLPLVKETSFTGYFEIDSVSGFGGGVSFAAFKGESKVFPVFKKGLRFRSLQLVQTVGKVKPKSASIVVLQNRAPSYVAVAVKRIKELYPFGFSSDPDYVFEVNAPSPEVVRVYFKSSSGDVFKEFFYEREKGEFSGYIAAYTYVENGKLKVLPFTRSAGEADKKFVSQLEEWLKDVANVAKTSYEAVLSIPFHAERVVLDGEDRGSAPVDIRLLPGVHTVSVDDRTVVVRVYPGKNTLSFGRISGRERADVLLLAFPSAKPTMDGKKPDSSVKLKGTGFAYRFVDVPSGLHKLKEGKNEWNLNIVPQSNNTFLLVRRLQCKGICSALFESSERGEGGVFYYTPYVLVPQKFELEFNLNNYGLFAVKFYTAGGTFVLYHDGKHLYYDDSDRVEGIMPSYSLPAKKVAVRLVYNRGKLTVFANGVEVFSKSLDMKGARVSIFTRACKVEKMRWTS